MDVPAGLDAVRRLALSLSADDPIAARAARRALLEWMAPSRLLEVWRRDSSAPLSLLREAEESGDPDVHAAVCEGLRRLFADAFGAALLPIDATHAAARFLTRALCDDDICRATAARPALLALLAADSDAATRRFLADALRAAPTACLLRLFDADRPEDGGNAAAAQKDVLARLVECVRAGPSGDALLFANALSAAAVAARWAEVPGLFPHIAALLAGADEDAACAASRAAAVILRGPNGRPSVCAPPAAEWAAAAHTRAAGCGTTRAKECFADVMAASAASAEAWAAAGPFFCADSVRRDLQRADAAVVTVAMRLLAAVAQSAHVADEVLAPSLLHAAWDRHRHPNDDIREALWVVLARGLARPAVEAALGNVCAAFLCAEPNEPLTAIRALQIEAANHLCAAADIPQTVRERLEQFCSAGLYPPGSAGVAALSRH